MRVRAVRCWLALLLSSFTAIACAQESDLGVQKDGPAGAAAGTNVTYAITLTNFGPDDAPTAQLTDALPAGTTFVALTQSTGPAFSCSTPAIGDPGSVDCSIGGFVTAATATFSLTVAIDPAAAPGTFITNLAGIGTQGVDPNDKNNQSPSTLQVAGGSLADVGILKSGPGAVGPDTDVVYTLTVNNAGPDAAGATTISDTLPGDLTFVSLSQGAGPAFSCTTPAVGAGGTITCDRPDLASGASTTFTLTAHVPAATPAGTEYVNSATATSAADPNDENNTATTTAIVSAVDISLTKTGPANATAGDNLSYVLTVANAGPDTAFQVVLHDLIVAPATFVSLTHSAGVPPSCSAPGSGASGPVDCLITFLGAGQSSQVTLVVNLPQTYSGDYSNAATAASDSFDVAPGNQSASVTTSIAPPTTDLAAGKAAPAEVFPNDTLTYALSIDNLSANVALAATLTDTLPASTRFVSLTQTSGPTFSCSTPAVGGSGTVSCTLAALAGGAGADFDLLVQLVDPVADGFSLDNTATVSSSNPDTNAANDDASASTNVTNRADLTLTKSAPASTIAGGRIDYALTLGNGGDSAAEGVQWVDVLPPDTRFVSLQQTAGPAFSCSTPAVGASGSVTCIASGPMPRLAVAEFTLAVDVTGAVANGTVITNTATASATTQDPVPGNNSDSATTTVTNQADLAVTKTAPANAAAGTNLTYALTLQNLGSSPAIGAQLVDALPTGTRFVSLQQTGGAALACTTPAVGAAGTVTCTAAAPLAASASAAFSLVVSVLTSVTDGTVVTNTATASTTTSDAVPGNDSDSATTTISNFVDVTLTKTGPAAAQVGSDLAYTLTIGNAGTSPASGIGLTDPLPAGTTFRSLQQTSGPTTVCSTPAVGAGGTVTCSIADLAAGASTSLTLVINAGSSAPGTLTNSASVSTTSTDASPANNAASAGTVLGVVAVVPRVIPTLGNGGLLLLALLLALLGVAMVRRVD